jgi:hypothetical protein
MTCLVSKELSFARESQNAENIHVSLDDRCVRYVTEIHEDDY